MVDFTKKLQAEGKADSTINRSLAALRRMFHLAKQSKKIRELPHFPMLTEPPARRGVLKHDKYPELLAALPDYLRPVLALGYHTWMRVGEIQRLKWEQVDFLSRIIRLNAGETKNDEAQEIPINDDLYAMLEQCHLKRRSGNPFVCSPGRATDWRLPTNLVRSLLETRPRSARIKWKTTREVSRPDFSRPATHLRHRRRVRRGSATRRHEGDRAQNRVGVQALRDRQPRAATGGGEQARRLPKRGKNGANRGHKADHDHTNTSN
jgi:integrase